MTWRVLASTPVLVSTLFSLVLSRVWFGQLTRILELADELGQGTIERGSKREGAAAAGARSAGRGT